MNTFTSEIIKAATITLLTIKESDADDAKVVFDPEYTYIQNEYSQSDELGSLFIRADDINSESTLVSSYENEVYNMLLSISVLAPLGKLPSGLFQDVNCVIDDSKLVLAVRALTSDFRGAINQGRVIPENEYKDLPELDKTRIKRRNPIFKNLNKVSGLVDNLQSSLIDIHQLREFIDPVTTTDIYARSDFLVKYYQRPT